ncbi:unnamed protein product [Schistosoma mattheei]|uniref:Uncharacterized protein n=1 Tax=Schistosoma mattheei TaxID=31246 RepID=A0A183NLA9_9TREM|nr:unnamed protein product [Schistosoma mattheei]
MAVKDRCSDNIDTSSFTFPLKTLGDLQTSEATLQELKFSDQFVSCNRCFKKFYVVRLSEIVCDDPWKSTKAYLAYVLTPELAITYTLKGTKSRLDINNYRFFRTNKSSHHSTDLFVDVLFPRFRMQPVQKVEKQAMDIASQAFLHDTRDKVYKRGWRSKERLTGKDGITYRVWKELLRMSNCSFQDARTACVNYEAVNEPDIQSTKISNTLLSRHDEIQPQGQSNLRSFNSDSRFHVNMKGVSTRNYKANHKGETKFGKCLSCGKFHSRKFMCIS